MAEVELGSIGTLRVRSTIGQIQDRTRVGELGGVKSGKTEFAATLYIPAYENVNIRVYGWIAA